MRITPANWDFDIDGASDFDGEFTYKSGGVAVDLTGCSIKHQFVPINSNTPSFEWSTVNNKILITNATQGVFEYNVSYAEIKTLNFVKAKHEFEITFSNNKKKRLAIGIATLISERKKDE